MDCPKCRLSNHPSAQRCDCGFDFTTNTVEQSYLHGGVGGAPAMGMVARLSTTTGRMSRQSYWVYTLSTLVAAFVYSALWSYSQLHPTLAPLLMWTLVVLLPASLFTGVTTAVQRLHDTGQSGHWAWLFLVPGASTLLLLFVLFAAGQSRDNEYGTVASVW